MIVGSTLIKIRPNLRQYHRFFSVTEDLTAVRWVPSKKSNKAQGEHTIAVEQETRQGRGRGAGRGGATADTSRKPYGAAASRLWSWQPARRVGSRARRSGSPGAAENLAGRTRQRHVSQYIRPGALRLVSLKQSRTWR